MEFKISIHTPREGGDAGEAEAALAKRKNQITALDMADPETEPPKEEGGRQ